jgi:hypothetical protein
MKFEAIHVERRTQDYKDGVTAFKERRPSRFTGR